jgi:aspartyl-tRNA(Asn)/glutamyl-tRNA(Gln) amidotransferase subunit B
MIWETVIGLEVHVQLNTQSKLFSGAATTYGAAPNTQTSFIDAGLPGVLPVLNQEAVEKAIQFGLAINARINDCSYFERKNYFYPDLPKGYQISQFKRPIIEDGVLSILNEDGSSKTITILRAHLEEDAGKSVHSLDESATGIDLNRAGVPLLEVVTTPCMHSAKEVVSYLKALHQLVKFLNICDGNMQEGSFRCDVNISLRPQGSSLLGVRSEIKNLNSFRFIEKAIAYEQARHQDLLESGNAITQETRLFSPAKNSTFLMRSKENESDYRYFPDPDLLPIRISEEWLVRIKQNMPPLPEQIRRLLREQDKLKDEEVEFLLSSPEIYQFYLKVSHSELPKNLLLNWIRGPLIAALSDNSKPLSAFAERSLEFVILLEKIHTGKITASGAKRILYQAIETNCALIQLITPEELALKEEQYDLPEIIGSLINQYPRQAEEIRQGKEKLMAFFVGQVMKITKSKSNPVLVNQLLKDKIFAG